MKTLSIKAKEVKFEQLDPRPGITHGNHQQRSSFRIILLSSACKKALLENILDFLKLTRVAAEGEFAPHLVVVGHDGVAVFRVEGVHSDELGSGLDFVAALLLHRCTDFTFCWETSDQTPEKDHFKIVLLVLWPHLSMLE